MHLHIYAVISTNEHRTYEFLSKGPKGAIKKVILFEEFGNNFYNLGFGDWDEATQLMDDKARSNNHDRDKVIATVASAFMNFIKYYPNATVFAKGSTPARTRLYQMGIFANWQEISILLTIKGYIDGDWQPIEKCKNYDAFMVRIK
jgi:hypothetical protein